MEVLYLRDMSDGELINLSGILTMEKDGLAVARAIQPIISDDKLKTQAESAIMAAENRIKGIQQFINENNVNLKGDE